jgi:cytochrome c5
MFNIVQTSIAVKKIITIIFLLIVTVSCSKRVSSNKSVQKSNTTVEPIPSTPVAVMAEKKEEVKTNVNPLSEAKIEIAKPMEMEKAPTKEDIAATEAKKKLGLLMTAGKEAYSVKCTKCHEAFEPTKFNAAKWEKVIDWMGPRAKLEAHEKEAILAYVKNNAKK